jgi:hypothetical protein
MAGHSSFVNDLGDKVWAEKKSAGSFRDIQRIVAPLTWFNIYASLYWVWLRNLAAQTHHIDRSVPWSTAPLW